MSEAIFKNKFSLNFKDNEAEENYMCERSNSILKYYPYLFTFLLISSLSSSIFISFYIYDFFQITISKVIVITAYFSTFIHLVCGLILLKTKNFKIIKWLNITTSFLFFFTNLSMRFVLLRILHVYNDTLFYLLMIEIIIRLTWVILLIQGFYECFFYNFLPIVIALTLEPFIYPTQIFKSGLLNGTACVTNEIVVLILAYFIEKQIKKAFYYFWISNKKNKWLTNIFDNMNTGFFSIKDKKIIFINNYLLNIFEKINKSIELEKSKFLIII